MLPEMIRELNITDQNTHVTSAQVLAWAKGIEAQRAKETVINSFSEVKDFGKIQTARDDQKKNGINCIHLLKCLQGKKMQIL